MRFRSSFKTAFITAAVVAGALLQSAPAQEIKSIGPPEKPEASKGLPPRPTPGDYQTHGQAGMVTIAAEFDAHGIPDPTEILSSADYVMVEVALFGPAGTKLPLNFQDFSLRINGKKPLAAQPYEFVFKSLRTPEYEQPTQHMLDEANKKTSINTGANGQSPISTTDITNPTLPPIVHVPLEVQRAWQQKIHMAALPEGDRPLPQAGLLFFQHDGKKFNTVELLYNGPAGKAKIELHP